MARSGVQREKVTNSCQPVACLSTVTRKEVVFTQTLDTPKFPNDSFLPRRSLASL